jgi:hypothetical protein
MNRIDFSYCWNDKLRCIAFTTFRLNSDKYVVGNEYDIYLQGEYLYRCKLLDKKILKLKDVNMWITNLDTGLNVDEFKWLIINMYAKKIDNVYNVDFALLLLKRIDGTENKKYSKENNK